MTELDGPSYQLRFVQFDAVNDNGEVVGLYRKESAGGTPADWKAGGGQAIALDQGTGEALGINNAGVIVGRVGTNPAAWRGGSEKVLAMPQGVTYASAMAINNDGDVVGQVIQNDVPSAFLRLSNAKVVLLPPLPGLDESLASSMNDSNVIVGSSFNADGLMQAVEWIDRKPVALPALGGQHSEARQINNHGDIVGDADMKDGKQHACLWHQGKSIDLGTLAGDDNSRALGINDGGVVVGISGYKTAFVWKDGKMYRLKDLMTPQPSWEPAQATAINNKGQIAGWGSDPDGHIYGFLLTPQ